MLRSGVFSSLNLSRAVRSLMSVRAVQARPMSHGPVESDEAFDARYIKFFSKPDIDCWEVRQGMNDLSGMDLVPDPKIIEAALHACRRLNDYALAVRFLEAIKYKSLGKPEIYTYVIQEIKPTLDQLGIDTPEALGYDKPELAISNVYEIH